MTDFLRHIQEGIATANTAEAERAEIHGILDRLNIAIRTATLGNAELYLGEFRHKEDEKTMGISDLPQRLVIRSTKDDKDGRIIAGWDVDIDGGYSVSLVYNFMRIPCGSAFQLTEELSVLMESARVGRAIQQFSV